MQTDKTGQFSEVKGARSYTSPFMGVEPHGKRVAAERVNPGLNAQGERDCRFDLMRTPWLPTASSSVAGPLHLEESATSPA